MSHLLFSHPYEPPPCTLCIPSHWRQSTTLYMVLTLTVDLWILSKYKPPRGAATAYYSVGPLRWSYEITVSKQFEQSIFAVYSRCKPIY